MSLLVFSLSFSFKQSLGIKLREFLNSREGKIQLHYNIILFNLLLIMYACIYVISTLPLKI
jgi:hypothetical protein